MNPVVLKVVHLAGALGLFTAMGAIISTDCASCKKSAGILHGISMLLLFVAGFAILKKPPMELHYWKVKIVLWLLLGVLPVLAKRKALPKPTLMAIVLATGVFAAYLGVQKPF
jgi:hypothetical protein